MTPLSPEMINGVDAFELVMAQYNNAIVSIKPVALMYAKSTYNYLALFSIVVALLSHFLKSKIDATEALLDFVKTIVALYVVFFMIWSWDQWAGPVWSTFKNLGTEYATAIASGPIDRSVTIEAIDKPSALIKQAVDITQAIFDGVMKHLSLKTMALGIFAFAACGVVLFCFARIATELIIVDIGGRLILFGGSFMLAFGASPWTRQYYEKFISAVFNVAIKTMFVRMLVGLGVMVSNQFVTWLHMDTNASGFFKIIVAIGISTYVYYLFCLKLPDMAASLLSGSFSVGLSSGDANLNTVMQGARGAGRAMQGAAVGVGNVASNIGGAGRLVGSAFDMANKLTSKQNTGKPFDDGAANAWNVGVNTLGTIGKHVGRSAAKAWKNGVKNTGGAQLSKSVDQERRVQEYKRARRTKQSEGSS